ncbi:MFS transporter [Mesorhizobium sp.]|uniref:MFS transporter n=1 Tax=Mesorhizobium sp. TaxID=1871066 RepID=UPI0025C2ACD8|nr:MFS transporter [Mesorhizobium sp.]
MKPQWYQMLDRNARRAFWTSFAGFSLDAMDVQLYAFVLPVLLTAWGLSHTEAGLLASATLVSSAAGGWITGLLADRIGRIRVLKVTILWLAISTCLCGLADNFGQLLVARLLQGLGFGGEWAAGVVFVAEVVAPEIRGRAVGMVQSAWAVGWGMAAAISAFVLALAPPDLGWRITFVVGFLPAVLVYVYRTRLKESETFLKAGLRSSWHAIFSRSMAAATIKGSLLATGMHGGYWAIATWWPVMLRSERGLSTTATSAYLAAIATASFFGYVSSAWLGDRIGRKATLVGFALGGTLAVLACTELQASNFGLLLLSFPLGFFALGMFSAIGPVLTELYPTEIRGSGLGFCYNFGRGMAGSTPLLIGGSAANIGISHAIGIYATCAYGLVLLVTIFLPETRGQKLRSVSEARS